MTKKEAIKIAKSRQRNQWLQWHVIKWNDEYAIASSQYMARNPSIESVYSTVGEKAYEFPRCLACGRYL